MLKFKSLFLGCVLLCTSAVVHAEINIIPQPVQVKEKQGVFKLDENTGVFPGCAEKVITHLRSRTGLTLKNQKTLAFILLAKSYYQNDSEYRERPLHIDPALDPLLGDEGYRLNVKPNGVEIIANTDTGVFYGIQTFLQLLPPEIESDSKTAHSWEVPCVEIVDYPRFQWRGLMLDVSRNFFTKTEVLRHLDMMSRYKFNLFHFHLSDDQGWRIEIPALPKLIEVGARRVPRTGIWWQRTPPLPGEVASDVGYYTQDDIREIVAYAAERHIRVLPEIDLPGHSGALVASYPALSCTHEKFHVNAGWKFNQQNTVCIGNEEVYDTLDTVFAEIAKLFPFEYIHIGADEAKKAWWAKCPKCKETMTKENLKNTNELQSHFVRRMQKIFEKHNRKLIGWEEIMEGGLPAGTTLMSWQYPRSGETAARKGHHVVMSPRWFCYLDYYQGEEIVEPNTFRMNRLTDIYKFEVQPKGVPDSLMLGAQGNLWTESVPNYAHAEYMYWPRGLAMAENVWSPKESKAWKDFTRRVEAHFKRLDQQDVNYARSVYNAIFTPKKISDTEMVIELGTELDDLVIHYTFDNTNPTHRSARYTQPLRVPMNAVDLKVNTFRGKTPMGTQINMPIKTLKERAKIK